MKLAEYILSGIITDSVMKKEEDSDAIYIVKADSLSSEDMVNYSPFNLALIVGQKDFYNMIVKKLVGGVNTITSTGVKMIGSMPLPVEKTYTVGDKITADGVYSSDDEDGFATITQILNMEDKTDVNEFLNYFQKVNKEHNYQVKYAETVEMAAEDEEVFGEGYETFMAELGMSYYPQSKMYESNV